MTGDAPTLSMNELASALSAQGISLAGLVLDHKGTIAGAAADQPMPPTLPRIQLSEDGLREGDLSIKRALGAGGMGEVLLAEQRALGREVAVKRVRVAPGGTGGSAAARGTADLLREALVTGGLEHPGIVPVHLLALAQDGTPCFVMKRIEGTPWSQLLRDPGALAALSRERTDPLVLHLEILLEVCDAVAFAHSKGVLHRDLKPANVMIGAFGETYVLDWGIAVGLGEGGSLPRAQEVRDIAGTPAYMAPEMASAQGVLLSERTDVYLLGAILHEVLTGRPPHPGDTVVEMLMHAWSWTPETYEPDVPAELASVCQRAMALRPSDRFASVREFRAAVVDFLRHRDALALCAEAEGRAAAVRGMLGQPGRPTDELALHSAFSEARFGFTQALRLWPDHPTARASAEALVVHMLEHQLARDDLNAARVLLAQLGEPPPELVAKIEALSARQAGQAERVAALERLERETDLEVAGRTRGFYALLVGLAWGVIAFGVGWLVRTGRIEFAFREALLAIGAFGATSLLIVRLRWRREDLNRAQTRLLRSNWLALASFFVFWAGTWSLGLRFQDAMVLFMYLVAVEWGVAAVLFDGRAAWVALSFAIGAVATGFFPAAGFEIFGLATVVGFVPLGRAWRRGRA